MAAYQMPRTYKSEGCLACICVVYTSDWLNYEFWTKVLVISADFLTRIGCTIDKAYFHCHLPFPLYKRVKYCVS